jgi:prefoldin subunit 5
MPHVLGNAGGPPPPTRNETLLREAIDRLRLELEECQNARETAIAAVSRWEQAYAEQAAKHEAEHAELRAAREELRAARKIIESTRGHNCSTRWLAPCVHQERDIVIYDHLVVKLSEETS